MPLTMGSLMVLAMTLPGRLQHPGASRIVVAAPMCGPIRNAVLSTFKPYQLKPLDVVGTIEKNVFTEDDLYQVASVLVKPEQANWAEYLLMRSGRFRLLSRPVNPGNMKAYEKHKGKMPRPWVDTEPWIEKGCKKKGDDDA